MKAREWLEILRDSEESEGMPDGRLTRLIRPTARTICPGRIRVYAPSASTSRLMQLQTWTDKRLILPTSIINPVLK